MSCWGRVEKSWQTDPVIRQVLYIYPCPHVVPETYLNNTCDDYKTETGMSDRGIIWPKERGEGEIGMAGENG